MQCEYYDNVIIIVVQASNIKRKSTKIMQYRFMYKKKCKYWNEVYFTGMMFFNF